MRVEICSFSSKKIQPGHGKLFGKKNGTKVRFAGPKEERYFHQRKKPENTKWSLVSREARGKTMIKEEEAVIKQPTKKILIPGPGLTMEKIEELRKLAENPKSA